MQILKLFLSLVLILINVVSSNGQNFEIISTDVTQTSQPLIHISAINDSTIIAVGAGVIVKTTDYGISWEPTYVENVLQQVGFSSDSVGYVVGHNSTIMKTTDQGDTWVDQNTAVISDAHTAYTVAFLNDSTGFVGLANGPGYAFLKTFDGGDNWEKHIADTVFVRSRLQVINDSTVYGVGHGQVFYKTTNSGQSWSEVSLPAEMGTAQDIFFFNSDTGIVALREFSVGCGSDYTLARTTDGGDSWLTNDFPCENFYSFTFPNYHVGFALGTSWSTGVRTMWRSTNAGLTWEILEYPVGEEFQNTSCMATSISCVDQDTCYMPTNYGTIIKMTNASAGLVEVPEIEHTIELKVFPNPATDHFYLEFQEETNQPQKLEIYTLTGQHIKSAPLSGGQRQKVDVSDLEAGMYVVRLIENNLPVGAAKLLIAGR